MCATVTAWVLTMGLHLCISLAMLYAIHTADTVSDPVILLQVCRAQVQRWRRGGALLPLHVSRQTLGIPKLRPHRCQWLLIMAVCMLAVMVASPFWCCIVTFTVMWSAIGVIHLNSLHHSCSTDVLDFAWYSIGASFGTTAAVFAFSAYLAYLHRHQIYSELRIARQQVADEISECYGSVTSYASNT